MEERVERLENAVALQDRTIEKLNDVVFEQQKQIDNLEKQLELLAGKYRQLKEAAVQGPPDDAPPPHYGG